MFNFMNDTAAMNTTPAYLAEKDTFETARAYLNRVTDLTRKASLLEGRIALRNDDIFEDGSYGTVTGKQLKKELDEAEKDLRVATVQVTDLIGRLADVTQQVVMTKRYVDGKSWDAIAEDMDIGVRTVQKAHGKALPTLEKMLKAAGK